MQVQLLILKKIINSLRYHFTNAVLAVFLVIVLIGYSSFFVIPEIDQAIFFLFIATFVSIFTLINNVLINEIANKVKSPNESTSVKSASDQHLSPKVRKLKINNSSKDIKFHFKCAIIAKNVLKEELEFRVVILFEIIIILSLFRNIYTNQSIFSDSIPELFIISGLIVSSILFGIAHAESSLYELKVITSIFDGFLWGALLFLFQSFWIAFLCHFGHNFLVAVIKHVKQRNFRKELKIDAKRVSSSSKKILSQLRDINLDIKDPKIKEEVTNCISKILKEIVNLDELLTSSEQYLLYFLSKRNTTKACS